ncbi:universal stress protein [Streptomyces sp. NPDC052071]|uniref:universal stress protein n=1 Tax=Streptomyces TaxID=1883 RepID=UPI0029BBF794|nr:MULTISPECIES: universal stress protein [Streptomyces]MDX2623999.1 universal stress protein [Streptomyces sp. WI03-5b]WSK30576.1 universal stress protein [[Kitasatospora] papulosa]
MTPLLCRPRRDRTPRLARAGLVQPAAAVLTDRIDDLAVAEAAARIALARRVPVLLIAVMPPGIHRQGDDPFSAPLRAVLARVMPKIGPSATGYIPEAFHLPAGRASRLAAAKELLALATRHRAPDVVTARRGPHGLDAHALIEAAALRGGPFVHAVAPAAWGPLQSPSAPAGDVPSGPWEGNVPR